MKRMKGNARNYLRAFFVFGAAVLALAAASLAAPSSAYAAERDAKIFWDAQALEMQTPPITHNGRLMIPLREVSEQLYGAVEWNAFTKTVDIAFVYDYDNSYFFRLQAGSPEATVNGKAVKLDAPLVIQDGRTYVPLRFLFENMGLYVTWDADANAAYLTEDKPAELFKDKKLNPIPYPLMDSGLTINLPEGMGMATDMLKGTYDPYTGQDVTYDPGDLRTSFLQLREGPQALSAGMIYIRTDPKATMEEAIEASMRMYNAPTDAHTSHLKLDGLDAFVYEAPWTEGTSYQKILLIFLPNGKTVSFHVVVDEYTAENNAAADALINAMFASVKKAK